MTARLLSTHAWLALGLTAAVCGGAAAATAIGLDERQTILVAGAVAIGLPVAYLLWYVEPAYVLTAGVMLSPLAGNWEQVGVPGYLGLDRLLLAFGIGMIVLRSPRVRDHPPIRLEAAHWALAAAVLFVVVSAAIAGTAADRGAVFRLIDAYGILPFLLFAFGPVAFRTARQRQVLLAGLICLGAYLGLTALFERLALNELVLPKYILDPSVGSHFGRSRGPFIEASTNGFALFTCFCAAAIVLLSSTRPRIKVSAATIGFLCILAAFFTMQRNVWIAALLGIAILLVAVREARRFLIPLLVAGALIITSTLMFSPTVRAEVEERVNATSTVYDRQNMNRAAVNMVEARPLTGFGWGRYAGNNTDYFEQSPDYALGGANVSVVHNVFLHYGAELGLVGVTIWLFALVVMVGGALRSPARGDLRYWKYTLAALGPVTLSISLFTPPKPFVMLFLCLWSGVVWAGRYQDAVPPPAEVHRVRT